MGMIEIKNENRVIETLIWFYLKLCGKKIHHIVFHLCNLTINITSRLNARAVNYRSLVDRWHWERFLLKHWLSHINCLITTTPYSQTFICQ